MTDADLASRRGMVNFQHRWPSIFNLGDFLCSPRHYFHFEAGQCDDRCASSVTIVGGGAYNQLGCEVATAGDGSKHIAWGVGRSIAYGTDEPAPLKSAFDFHSEFSTRDPDLASEGVPLVPCVSVMHELVDLPPGHMTGLFLNENPGVGASARNLPVGLGDVAFGTNAMAEHDFIAMFARTSRLVTNSYHVAYWGLLSGREVAVIGYSSKFDNLLRLLGIDDAPLRYTRGDGEDLARAIARHTSKPAFLRIPNHLAIKDRFRQTNREFAQRLVERGLLSFAEPCSSGDTIQQRMQLFHQHYHTVLRDPG